METDKCIQERRSVRKYLKKKVSWDGIAEILEAGIQAPCAGGIQNYHFIVIQKNKKREDIANACKQSWMIQAPVFIVICNDKQKSKKFYEDSGERYSVQNCAVVAENILLKAYSLGLSTCWVGAYDEIELAGILKLPENVSADLIITLGYSDSKPKSPKRLPLDTLTFFEEFGNAKR